MESDIQPITCWPPDSPTQTDSQLSSVQILDSHFQTKETDLDNFQPDVKKFRRDPEENFDDLEFADVALAKWWKRHTRGKSVHTLQKEGPITLNVYSKMAKISRSNEAQRFFSERVDKLTSSYIGFSNPHVQAVIGSYLEKLGKFHEAKKYLAKAVHTDPTDNENAWLLARLHKQLKIIQAQEESLSKPLPIPTIFPEACEVARVCSADLSFADFFINYALTSTPVIITGLKLTDKPWTLNHVKVKAGHCPVTPKRHVPESVEWAKLENADPTTVAKYIDSLPQCNAGVSLSKYSTADQHNSQQHTYLFDWSIFQHAPQLASEITIPQFFAGDLLQRALVGSLYRDTWPSLFIAPGGLKSELHVDTFASNFWMALFEGSKRWVFFNREDLPYLYPSYPHSMDPCFDVDLSNPDTEKFPLLCRAKPKECILEAGEVLFVPSGCPHYVENISQSVAISANFVDPSNLLPVLAELSINGLRDPRAADLYQQLKEKCADLIKDLNNMKPVNKSGSEDRIPHSGNNVNDSCDNLIKDRLKVNALPPSIQSWINDVQQKGNRKWQDFKVQC